MALRCSNCGRFVSANYPCTNSRCVGIDVKVPVVYKNKPSPSCSSASYASPSYQERRSVTNIPNSFLDTLFNSPSVSENRTAPRASSSSSTMSSEYLSNIRESLTTLKEQVTSLQIQVENLKTENQTLKGTKEELIILKSNLEKEIEQKIQQVINHFKDAMNQTKLEKLSFDKKLEELNHVQQDVKKSCIVLEKKLVHEETSREKVDTDLLMRFTPIEKSIEAILGRCTIIEERLQVEKMTREEFCNSFSRKMDYVVKSCNTLEEKLKFEEKSRQELNLSSSTILDDLKKDKWELMGRCNTFEEQLRQEEMARREIMAFGSELKGRMVSLERQQRNREIIIIILVLIIFWTLYPSFVTQTTALSRYTFDKYKQLA